jgi:hypothetical protein
VAITKPHSNLWLVWRSILPSGTSFIGCTFVAVATVLVGLLAQSQQQGTALFGMQLGSTGVIALGGRLGHLFSDTLLNNTAIIGLWLVLLLCLSGMIEFLLGSYASLKDVTKQAAYIPQVHPDGSERRWLLDRALWRVAVGLFAAVGAATLVHPAHWVSSAERTTISGSSLGQALWSMSLAVVIWAVIYHFIVVVVRQYTFRTRLFGDRGLY